MAGLRERFPPRRIIRLLGWNALILFVLLALAAGGTELYLRLTAPPVGEASKVSIIPGPGDPWFDLLHNIAGNRGGIPIINQYEHITARGGEVRDARWLNDFHWTPTGHRWAAEAIWEWLKANPEVCD